MSPANPIVYQLDADRAAATRLSRYMRWLAEHSYVEAGDYDALHRWSIESPEAFWASLWAYFDVIAAARGERVLSTRAMPGARFFEDARLNFAENMLREALHGDPGKPAIVGVSESRATVRLTYGELLEQAAAFEGYLVALGVGEGDRVAGVVAHTHEPIVALLACASLGAIWSSASPDFGVPGLVDRFAQIAPKVLVTVDGYRYGGKAFERVDQIEALRARIPSIEHVVVIANADAPRDLPADPTVTAWHAALDAGAGHRMAFVPGAFDRPLYILYSSGTTGVPKCIVHGAGGALLQHAKEQILHGDLRRDDTLFYFTTCGWMMWNWQVSALFTGATLVLYDGNPGYPDMNLLWRLAEAEGITHFGTSAKWIAGCRNAEIAPGDDHDLSALRVIFSTGSPLLPADFDWVYAHVKADVLLGSVSGGTDIVSSFVGCCPLLPVRRGEIQCRLLGMAAAAFNDRGESVIDECGELVCTQPVPSMPVMFWNDPDGARYRAAYFDTFDGVWAHGDYILFTPEGGSIIYGRSDATLNVGGVRIGTAEIYRQVEPMAEIADCLVAARTQGEDDAMVLLVVLAPEYTLSDELTRRIRARLRENASPRHVPGVIAAVDALPYTRSGKKVEMAVTKILNGRSVDNTGAIANPESLDAIAAHPRLAADA